MSSITLHPEYGVNPTCGMCFWCGGYTNELALLGRNRGKKAPRQMVLGYEPCDKCKSQFAQGVQIMECSTRPLTEGQPEIQQGVYPTGRMVVVTLDFVNRAFDAAMARVCCEKRKAFMDVQTFQTLFGEKMDANS